MTADRTWIQNEDPDYAICYVTSDIAVFKLKRASCSYRVAVDTGSKWTFIEPGFGRFFLNGCTEASPEFHGSIYYANDAFRLANDIRRNGVPS